MRVGFYECDITPPLGCNMPGYYRANPATDVLERIYADAMDYRRLDDMQGKTVQRMTKA